MPRGARTGRAPAVTAVTVPQSGWPRRGPRAGKLVSVTTVDPNVRAPSVEEFAATAADWLAAHREQAPPDYGAICPPELVERGRAWQRLLDESGYAGIHWPVEHGGQGLQQRAPGGLADGVREGRRAARAEHGRARARRRGDPPLRHAGAAGPAPATDVARRPGVVPAVLRARRRQRPRRVVDEGRARRRPLRRQRPEGVVLGRAGERLGHPDGPHEPGGRQARRHLVLPVPDGPAGHRDPPAQADDRRLGVRRGLLHRRASSPPTACSARCTAAGASA